MEETIAIYTQQSKAATLGKKEEKVVFRHLLSHALCQQRHTISNLICTSGLQQQDWSRDYRLYASKLDPQALFDPLLEGIVQQLGPDAPLVIAVDDSTLPKTGKRIPGAGWHRDPLSPPFRTNLSHSLKFIQLSVALPDPENQKRARMIPIGFAWIPKVPAPPQQASPEQLREYEGAKAQNTPSAHALRLLEALRNKLDQFQPQISRRIRVCGDGHYSTSTFLQGLGKKTTYIGRIRGDTHLCALPEPSWSPRQGRKPSYGQPLPTPEELRQDKKVPWKRIQIENKGKSTWVRFKCLKKVKWQKAGEKQTVQVLVMGPFRYKRTQKGPWRYTQPAYLLCTDPTLSVRKIIQTYLWRWDIEVNFKEEKQLFGMGHAQVRDPRSVYAAPAVALAAYAGLLLAGVRVFGFNRLPLTATPPKWYPHKRRLRISTGQLLREFRHAAVAHSLGLVHFSEFSSASPEKMNAQKWIRIDQGDLKQPAA